VDRLEADKKEVSASLDKKREELEELMRAMKTETSTETQLKEANAELDHAKGKMADYKKDLDDVNQKYQVADLKIDFVLGACGCLVFFFIEGYVRNNLFTLTTMPMGKAKPCDLEY
jgi:hypothetical protein